MKNAEKIIAATGAFVLLMTVAAVTFCGLPEKRLTNREWIGDILTQSAGADPEQPLGSSGFVRLLNMLNPGNTGLHDPEDADILSQLEPIRSLIRSFSHVHDLTDPQESDAARAALPERALIKAAQQMTGSLPGISVEPETEIR